jgi:hypothetical protein
MQVILTPTAVADMFGPGLNGFASSVPGPPTEMSSEWFNSVQMEIANVILGQSIALDGLQFDQLKQAFDNYVFLDPTIGSTLTILSGAVLVVNSGGVFQCAVGSTATFATLSTSALATLASAATTTTMAVGTALTVGTTAAITGILSPLAGINLGAQQIAGAATSIVDVDRVLADKVELTDMATTFSNTGGHMRWNTTALMFAQSAVIAKTNAVEIPQRGFDLVFSTVNAIDDTTATVTRNIQASEPVWIEVYFRWEISIAATNMNFRVQVTGPSGSADLGTTTFRATVANVGYPFAYVLRWTPTDNFALPGTQSYAFLVRLGTGAGTLTCANIMVKIASALEV